MDLGLRDRVYIVTGGTRGLGRAAARELVAEGARVRRYGTPDEFGRSAAFLLSPAASYLTGVMVSIDGGVRRGF